MSKEVGAGGRFDIFLDSDFCTLKLLSPKDLTHIKHTLNVERGF